MDKIKLVQGDNLPYVNLSLTRNGGIEPLNLSDPTIAINIIFKAAGNSTVLATIPCFKTNGGEDGEVSFCFSGGVLDVAAGPYVGEIEIDFDGQIQTIYEVLKFTVRSQF